MDAELAAVRRALGNPPPPAKEFWARADRAVARATSPGTAAALLATFQLQRVSLFALQAVTLMHKRRSIPVAERYDAIAAELEQGRFRSSGPARLAVLSAYESQLAARLPRRASSRKLERDAMVAALASEAAPGRARDCDAVLRLLPAAVAAMTSRAARREEADPVARFRKVARGLGVVDAADVAALRRAVFASLAPR